MPKNDDYFPFKSTLSLARLFTFWQKVEQNSTAPRAAVVRPILERLEAHPDLAEPIHDLAVLDEHRDLLDLMMVAIFPAALWRTVIMAVTAPFQMPPFYTTPAFDELRIFDRGCPNYLEQVDVSEQALATARAMRAYYWILTERYGVPLPADYPLIFRLTHQDSGLDQYYKVDFNPHFTKIETHGDLPELTGAQIECLLAEPHNLDLWMETLPPEHFEFQGFVVLTAVEVTEQAVISALKDDLLKKDAMATPDKIDHLQHRLRSLLGQEDLELGLICLQKDDIEGITGAQAIGRSLLLNDTGAPTCPHKAESFYARVYERDEPLVVSDLNECAICTGFEQHLRAKGYRTLLLAPLRVEGKLIGILEAASRQPGAINALSAVKLGEAVSLFATAMKRTLDDHEDRIQAVIKEHYTAIHPAVEWRFREAAHRYLTEQYDPDRPAQIEPIIFDAVYPLYGLSDIRSSSAHRNAAIQADLLEQLSLAHDVVVEAAIYQPLPILDELSYRISRYADRIEPGASTEDETSVLDFLQNEVQPLFDQLKQFGPRVHDRIDAYEQALDPELQVLYKQRKDFEESVTRINDTMAAYLNEQEEHAQAMFPHYFELFKTDGVDYNIYIGAALVEDGSFHPLYLRNLRLWQLLTMCGVEYKLRALKPKLKMDLDATHLILVQSTPLSIRFRMEEKQFDVDGAYNIRYEIVKKRIDKAVIQGTNERLTQPGQIAIVYSQAREAQEYQRYLEYLAAAGYITGAIEEHELKPMQGVHGLKALRVTVSDDAPETVIQIDEIQAATKTMPVSA